MCCGVPQGTVLAPPAFKAACAERLLRDLAGGWRRGIGCENSRLEVERK